MSNLPTLLKGAALGSSLLLFSGFMWYQTVGYQKWSAPAVAEEPAAEDGEPNENTASVRDIELIDMSGSKSEAPLIKVPRQKTNEGGAQQQRVLMPGSKKTTIFEPNAPEPKPAPRAIMPGSKSAQMAVPPATKPAPGMITPKKPSDALLPGSKAPFPGFIKGPDKTPAPAQRSEPAPRPVMGGSKSKAVFVLEDTKRGATNATEHAKQILKEWDARINQERAGQTQRSKQTQAPLPPPKINEPQKQQQAVPRMYLESSKSGRIFVPPTPPLAPEKQR